MIGREVAREWYGLRHELEDEHHWTASDAVDWIAAEVDRRLAVVECPNCDSPATDQTGCKACGYTWEA